MNNREAFEAWMKKEMPHEPLEIIADSGVYLGGYVQTLWVGFQVGLASQSQQPTVYTKFKEGDFVFGLGDNKGCSQVFSDCGKLQPFDYLNDFNPDNYRLATNDEIFKAGIDSVSSQAQQTESQWISVEDQLPAYGQIVDLSIDGVLQNETYEIDATDNDLYLTNFWTRDGLEDGLDIEQGQFWRARLPMPKPLPPAPEVCSDGGKCGAGGYCITCPNVPAPDGDKP